MAFESPALNTEPHYPSLETLQENFKKKLAIILYRPLTVENIETFAEDAKIDIVNLTEEIRSYKNTWQGWLSLVGKKK